MTRVLIPEYNVNIIIIPTITEYALVLLNVGLRKNQILKKEVRCTEVSFMIFRTGSILIVGHCDESILICVYNFLKNILLTEFDEINIAVENDINEKKIKKKIKKKTIMVKTTPAVVV